MQDLTKELIKEQISDLRSAIHDIYRDGGDLTTEGNMEIDRLSDSIEELEEILEE